MNKQHQVILSLGTNQGDRLQNIQKCIELIHSSIGSVVKVSRLCESPAWGFESDNFYNCALVIHTIKPAEQVLEEVLALEKNMGRIRHDSEGYQARIIDIDIAAFDDDVIASENLQIPHPQMQNRLFVMLPMLDLEPEWVHPILKQSLKELIESTTDPSVCHVVQKLESPFEKMDWKSLKYIAVEGNIGAGKSTLVNKIAEDFSAKTVLERFADNPFLPKFYQDSQRYAFSLEMSFLAERYQQLCEDLSQFDLFSDFIASDYHIFKSLIFAKVTLTEDEYRLYKTLFDIIYKEVPKPDLYVYLYQGTEQLLENIKKRGREYELEIATDYLDKINNGYLDFIKSQKDFNVLVIDMTNRDFVSNQEDYLYVLEEIQKAIVR